MSNKVGGSRSGKGLRSGGAVLRLNGGRGTYRRRVTGSLASRTADVRFPSQPTTHTRTHTRAHAHTRIHARTHTHTQTHTHLPSLWLPLSLSWGVPQQFPHSGSPSGRRPRLLPIPSQKLAWSQGQKATPSGRRGQGWLSPTQSNPTPPLGPLPFVSCYMTVNRGRASGVLSEPRSRPLTL